MLSPLPRLAVLFGRRDVLHFAGLFVLMVLASLLEVLGIGAVPAFVVALADPDRLRAVPGVGPVLDLLRVTDDRHLVLLGAAVLLGIFVLRSAFLYVTYSVQARTTERYRVCLADRLFACYMRAPYELMLERNSAELVRNVNSETREILNGVINPLLNAVLSLLMAGFIVGLIVVSAPAISLLAVAFAGGGSWLYMDRCKRRLRRLGSEAQRERSSALKAVNEGLGAFIDARILQREKYFIESFHRAAAAGAGASRGFQVLSRSTAPVLETISVAALLLIVLLLTWRGVEPASLIPHLSLLGIAVVRLKSNVTAATTAMNQMRFSIVALDPIHADLTRLEPLAAKPIRKLAPSGGEGAGRKVELGRELRFEGVTYRYPGMDRPAVRDVTLRIERGQSVGFVGATGSGKSTLMNVLLGLLVPERGSIRADGIDIHADLRDWHRNLGYVPQTIYLLDDTIRRNIALGVAEERIDEARLAAAIRAAQFEEFVASLADGAQTRIGERGIRLSGGQRQRIGLARALYNDPEVLVLDEATSALDNHTEHLVMRAVEELRGSRTLIIVAHRLSTVRHCDRLYMMHDGRVVAEGTYDELTTTHEAFRRMAEVV